MIDFPAYAELLKGGHPRFPAVWRDRLSSQLDAAFDPARHGKWREWQDVLDRLPRVQASGCDFDDDFVTVGTPGDAGPEQRQTAECLLRELHPWRKGPFRVHGVTIDAEWRSNLKWSRLEHAIAPLEGRMVLDIGCGNGYYAWRMIGKGAGLVIGIDPTPGHVVQFLALKHFAGSWPVYVLPVGIEEVPSGLGVFDTVFSMGVLYHRRSPIDHLLDLHACLRPGGELILETLVIDGGPGQTLLPEDRYARMRNVWFIPSLPTLTAWLKRCRYRRVRVIDVTRTTVLEQRSTPWMRFQSLQDFLDPHEPTRTVEGLPAPQRAIVVAEVP